MKKRFLSNSQGVTMVALVVTIVILLILAGISIAMFTRSKLIDNAFESKIVTELNQLGEEVNKIKVQGEQELIQEGIFSGSVTNDTLINKQIIISTVTINNPSIKLGIIDISKFKVDSELGKNFSSYSSDSTYSSISDLSDVYAINLETNDIYYINRKVYTVKGTVPPEELTKPITETDGPTVSIIRDNEETENLKFTITASEGKDNIDLKEDNKYEYYLSTKPNDIVGGVWKEYTSGQEEVVEKTGNREYYIFVKIVEDKNDKISTAIGTNGTEVLVGGEKYHRFGPYEIENGSVLIIDPNGGEYKNSPEKATIKGKNNNSIIINSNDISIDKTITVNFNSNGGSTVNTIKTSTVFDSWTFEGTGKFENSIYTFGNGTGTLTANYKVLSIKLPSPSKTGNTFGGWYTDPGCTQSAGNAGEQYTPTKDTTLYAKWNVNKYYIDLNFNVDGKSYGQGFENRILVGLRIDGDDKGYIKDYYQEHNYGAKWEIYGLRLDGVDIAYTDSGTLGAEKLSITKYFYTITFNVNNGSYGTVSPTSLIVPNNNTKYTTSSNTLTLGDGRKVTATVTNSSGYTTKFTNWTVLKGTTSEATTSGTITGTTSITANFNRTANTYTASFDSNGGSTANPSSITKKFGEKLGTLPTTSRTGYTFAGWFTSATGGTQITADTTMPVNGATYYAHWNINQYTLTVNPNGGTWNNTDEISTFTQDYGTTKIISNPTVAPEGYTVTFNTDGGSEVAKQKSTKSFDKWTLSGNGNYSSSVNKPSSTGMSVSESSENGEKVYKFSYTANNPSVNTWYSSRFSPYTYTSGDTYEIRFKVRVNSVSNGGNITFRHSALANDYGTPGLKTQTFKATTSGWVDVSLERTISGTTTTLSGKTVNIAPVFEFYTANLLNTTASISFDIKGLEIINKTKHTLLQSMDNKYLFGNGNGTLTANYKNNSIKLPTATKTGHTFAGWYTNPECTQSAGNAGEQYTPTKDTTLYAKWNVNKYYIDLNFNVDGKVYGSGYEDRIYVKLKVAGVDKGYVKDYNVEHDYGTKWEITGLKLDNVEIPYSASGTLGAEKLSLLVYFYTITFNVNNSNYGTVSPTSLIVPNNNTKYTTSSNTLTLGDGRKVTATVTNSNGYTTTFSNWTVLKGTTSEATTSGTITGTTSMTANFNRTANTYTANFNSNGGSTANPSSITKKFGEKLGTLPTTSRTGYTFAGWFTSATGGTQITADTTMPVNGATYYAHWNINQYTLTVNPNGGTWNNTTEISSFEQNYGSTKSISNPTAPKGYTVTFDGNNGSTPSAQTSSSKFVNWVKSGEGTFSNNVFTFGAGDATLTADYSNSSIILPTSSRSGYEFIGWYNMVEGGTKIGDAGASYTPTEDITLYAQWKDIVPPTIDSIKVITQTGVYPAGKVIDIRLQFNEEIKGTSAPTVKVKFGNGAEKTLTPKEISTGQNYIDYTITIAQGDLGVLTISSISGGNITDISGNAATITTVSNTGNIVTADTVGPLASIYEDQNSVTNVSRVSVDVADYETDVAYVELPDGTRKTIYDELRDNVKVLILEEITSSATVSGLKSYEPIIRQYFSNVTVDSSYTAANIANTDFDIVISNANVWESPRQDVLKAAFDAGKNIITLGNDSNNKLNIIENTIATHGTSVYVKGKNQLVDNEITPKINFTTAEDYDSQHIITQLIDGAETWYTLECSGKEYPAIAYYEEHDTRWFHSQMASINFDSVMPYLIRKLTRITTASYEIPGPGTYTFKIYDQAGNCTEKTITTGNYKVTFEYNEENVKNGDFSNGLTNWWLSNTSESTATMDSSVLYNGKASVRFQVKSAKNNWIGFNNTTLANTCHQNELYRISFMAYKDSTSSYGDANALLSAYCPEFYSVTGVRYDSSAVGIDPKTMTDKHWTKVEKEFNAWGDTWTDIYIPFNTGGGGNCPDSTIWLADVRVERIQNQTKSYGSTLGTLPTLSRSGYTFQGWYTAPEGGTRITESTKVLSGNVTYYAHWARNSAPAKPSKPDLLTAHDTGFSNTDNATYWWSQLSLSGTAEAGSTLKLYRNNSLYGQTTVASNGTWSMKVDNYQNSWTSWVAYASNAAGTSPASDALSICSDISVPSISGLSATATSASKYRLNITASEAGGSGIRGYYVSTSSAKPSLSSGWAVTSATSYTFNNANPSTTYYVWVADNAGNISNAASITPQPINYSVNNTAWCTTFQQAVGLAGNGHTIYLLKNITDGSAGTINKNLTFTTNGHNLTRTASITVSSGRTVTITGSGTLTGNMGTLIYNAGTLNISHSGTISATASASNNVAAIQNNAGATLNKTGGGTVHGANIGIYSQGRVNMSAGTVTGGAGHALKVGTATGSLSMTGGTLSNSNTYGALNVYTGASATVSGGTIRNTNNSAVSTYGTTTISGSTNISGANSGITVQSGTLRVQGGTITGGSHGLINRGQCIISGGTIYTTGSSEAVSNGTASESVGLMQISGGTIYTTGSASAVTNHSSQTWPTSSKSGYITYCTQTDSAKKACTIHITGSSVIEARGSGYAIRNTSAAKTGAIHIPGTFSGRVYAKNNYVLVNTSTGSKYIYMNGGNLYCPKGSKYYSYGNVSINSAVRKYNRAP